MCGIVGYIGDENASDIVIDGLKRLEYRGYDSAGIALCTKDGMMVRKKKGRIKNLEDMIAGENLYGHLAIGHTRWATHGAPSNLNAHPHVNEKETIAVVHNGIVENFMQLKEWLISEHGVEFHSETDTEVIAQLIGIFYHGDFEDAVFQAVEKMQGAYGLGVICADEPGKLIAVRKDSPLIVGLGEGCNFIASDIPAILKHVRKIYLIENNETVVLTASSVKIYNAERREVHREVFNVTWDADAAEKEGYDHFMLKEIHEQPKGIRNTITRRMDEEGNIVLDGIRMTKEEIENFDLILAGNKTILEAAEITDHKCLRETEDKTFLKMFLRYLARKHKRVYLLVESEEEGQKMFGHFEEYYRGTQIVGMAKVSAKNRADDMLINAINGEEVDCVLSALSSPLQEELISKNRNVMNARVWLGLGKDGIPVAAKGIGGGRIGQFFMKQIFKKEIEKSKKRGN